MKDNIKFEYSAGGVVVNDNKEVLLIKTKNLKNETVITFPKGHIEKNETSQEAASPFLVTRSMYLYTKLVTVRSMERTLKK
jgi:hypothetical protein